jgi:hypothetical protein
VRGLKGSASECKYHNTERRHRASGSQRPRVVRRSAPGVPAGVSARGRGCGAAGPRRLSRPADRSPAPPQGRRDRPNRTRACAQARPGGACVRAPGVRARIGRIEEEEEEGRGRWRRRRRRRRRVAGGGGWRGWLVGAPLPLALPLDTSARLEGCPKYRSRPEPRPNLTFVDSGRGRVAAPPVLPASSLL